MGQFTEAANDFMSILDEYPGDLDALIGIADMYQVRGDFLRASHFLERALKANPTDERAYLARGLFELSQNNKEKARADIMKAYAINPYNPKVHYAFKKNNF